MSFTQFADVPGDTGAIHLLASDTVPQTPVLSFIVTQAGETTYFGQVTAPALWINRNAQNRFEPAAIEALLRIERGEMGYGAHFWPSQYYSADVMVQQTQEGPLEAPMTRPQAGASWQIASADEIMRFLALPAEGVSIAHIAGVRTREGRKVEIRVTAEQIRHHFLSAGATGSGKSNTNVNLILAAQAAGFCVIVFDMKPDFSEIDQPNDEGRDQPDRSQSDPKGLRDASFFSLSDQPRPNETLISVSACDLDPVKLAQALFFRPNEENQQEVTEQLLLGFAEIQEAKANERGAPVHWTFADFLAWLDAFPNAGAAANALPFRAAFNQQTFAAVLSKITRRNRLPSWIDATTRQRGAPFGGAIRSARRLPSPERIEAAQLFARLQPGTVSVIRVRAEDDGRSYALFLDYAMRTIAALRRDHAAETPPVMHLIDEAADIFQSPNRRLRAAMESTIDEQVRKGRSLSIGFVISAQSAGDIPERIRHNLNSVIVFRHRQPMVLREILPEMTDSIRAIAARLQPGEALVQLFKTNGLPRCRMNRSPAKLHRPDAKAPAPIVRLRPQS
jgi:uncharacterized protein DUF87